MAFLLDSISSYAFDHSHKLFSKILSQHVTIKEGQSYFNYKQMKTHSEDLNSYLVELSSVSKVEYQKFSKDEQLAFLINAYNGFTIKLILKNYPVKSIKDIGSIFKNTWKISFIKLLDKKMTLDNIEHDIIRKDFKESRIHFAVNCASIGCSSLYQEAFVGARLEEQLEIITKDFFRFKNNVDEKKATINLSKIFKWWGGDFKKSHGSLLNFIALNITMDKILQEKIKKGELEIEWKNYDWNLNE